MRPLVPDGPFDGFFIFSLGPQAYLEAFSLSGAWPSMITPPERNFLELNFLVRLLQATEPW